MKVEWDFHEVFDFANGLKDIGKFEVFCKSATEEIAKILLKLLEKNTPVDYGNLKTKWKEDNVNYLATRTKNGFEVVLINTMEYAVWVNDGHKQRPGRFIPGYWEGNHFRYDPNAKGGMVLKKPWVKGRFFVEISINQLNESKRIEQIVYNQLQKWWDSV